MGAGVPSLTPHGHGATLKTGRDIPALEDRQGYQEFRVLPWPCKKFEVSLGYLKPVSEKEHPVPVGNGLCHQGPILPDTPILLSHLAPGWVVLERATGFSRAGCQCGRIAIQSAPNW